MACSDPSAPAVRTDMGARIHGVEWTANDRREVPMAILTSAAKQLEVRGFSRTAGGTTQEIAITIHRYEGPGTYRIAVPDSGAMAYYEYQLDASSMPLHYFTNEDFKGSVTIESVDPARQIVTGAFQFTGRITASPAGTAAVTEGRFRGRYHAQ